ncbi:MAG: efflux RND transporter permease subunit [Firmicutes bacterium]|nr:efflux RND transporter permease subunit [Bacillota bacterium]
MEFAKQEQMDNNIRENGLTSFGVRRPHTVFVMIMVVLIIGVFALTSMNNELLPNMNLPFVIVVASTDQEAVNNRNEGLTSDDADFWSITLEDTLMITDEVESSISQINGFRDIQTTTAPGMIMAFIEFSSSVDIDAAFFEVSMTMMGMQNIFLTNLFNPMPFMTRIDPSMMPALTFSTSFRIYNEAVGNAAPTVNELATIDWYNDTMARAIRAVPGVAQITGSILGTATQPRPNSFADMPGFAYFNNEQSFSFAIQQTSGAVTTVVVADIFRAINQLIDENPGFAINVQMDQAEMIDESIGTVMTNLIIGGILAIFVMFVFLRNWKLTLAIGISIPLSVISTFILMFFMGITLNIVSLAGLALAVGMLIDNSIIVVENIYRLKQKGMSSREAAIKGASQIFGAVLAATFTTVAVFAPMFFVTGLMMEVFMDMVWVIIFSLLASLVCAIVFLPSIIAAFKIQTKQTKQAAAQVEEAGKLVADVDATDDDLVANATEQLAAKKSGDDGWFDRLREKADRWYNNALRFTIAKKWIAVGAAVVLFIGSLILAFVVNDVELMPAEDTGNFSITVQTNPIISNMAQNPAVPFVTRDGIFTIVEDVMTGELYTRIRARVGAGADIGMNFGAGAMAGMFGMGGSGIPNLMIDVTMADNYRGTTLGAAHDVHRIVEDFMDGVAGIDLGPIWGLVPQEMRDMLAQMGITQDAARIGLASNVSVSADGGMNMMAASGVTVTVSTATIRLPNGQMETLAQTTARLGAVVDLIMENIVEIEGIHPSIDTNFSPFTIVRSNGRIVASVEADLLDGYVIGAVQGRVDSMMDDLRRDNAAVFANIHPVEDGFAAQMAETMGQMILAILGGIVLMYLVMVAIFRSFKSPFIMLITIPLGFTGGFLLLLIFGMPISIVAMIGLLILMGVIINNGIVLVDYVNQAREDGLSVDEALIAACNTRLRPIMMTALSTVLAMIPMAIGWGASGAMMQPLALVTIGGLLYATVMSLLIVPAFYKIFNRDKKVITTDGAPIEIVEEPVEAVAE